MCSGECPPGTPGLGLQGRPGKKEEFEPGSPGRRAGPTYASGDTLSSVRGRGGAAVLRNSGGWVPHRLCKSLGLGTPRDGHAADSPRSSDPWGASEIFKVSLIYFC